MFSAATVQQLDAVLDPERVHTRRKQGMELRYLEGHDIIDRANAVFGYHAWSYQVTKLELAAGVWLATILLDVKTVDGDHVLREDVGVGIPAIARGNEEASPDAQETAIKGAVTDALKRALRTFGNAFGNSLYDKEDPNRAAPAAEGEGRPRTAGPGQASESQVNFAASLAKKVGSAAVRGWNDGQLNTNKSAELNERLKEMSKVEISAFIEWAKAQGE